MVLSLSVAASIVFCLINLCGFYARVFFTQRSEGGYIQENTTITLLFFVFALS